MWSSSNRQINYGIPSEMGMFVVASASSFQHNNNPTQEQAVSLDPHVINGSSSAAAATALGVGVGVGVIPLLAATPYIGSAANMGVDDDVLNSSRSKSSGIQLWQNQQTQHHHPNYLKKSVLLDHASAVNLLQSSRGGGGGSGGGGISGPGSSTTCQDCGNQAKKDCIHRRCRACCKSRGFDCPTHVKSTWVPAARRRERQLMSAAAAGATAGSSGFTSGNKKARLIASQTTATSHTSTSNTTPPRSLDTSSSHQDASFKEAMPGQVRAPAVFKCVRVTAVDDGEDEYAYQTVVKIGGHVFKGFLYDQGVESRDGFPNISELHLGAGSGGVGASNIGGRNGASSSSPILDPSEVYAATTGGLFVGSSYGNQIN